MSQPARFSRGCNGPKGTFADPYRWVPHCVFGIFPHINWELPDLAGASPAVATGRVTSRGLRVGTPGPWAGRAKEAMPRGLSLRVFRGTCALLSPASPRGQAYPSALQSGQGHPRGAPSGSTHLGRTAWCRKDLGPRGA